MKNEVRPIDANALARKIREYMEDFPNAKTRLATCRVVLSMLGDEGQTPTLTDHFPDLTKMMPLTLEQLREMDGQPVWVKCLNSKKYTDPPIGWRIVERSITGTIGVWNGESCFAERDYGVDWLSYAYPPAHIDREAWTGCVCNSGKKNCCTCISMECHTCIGESKYKRGRYCSSCGRPLTEEAWAELEKRMRMRE